MRAISRLRAEAAREARRLRALRASGLMDTAREPVFDDLTLLAARGCSAAVGLVTLVDHQRVWCKSAYGTSANEFVRDNFPCGHTVTQTGVHIIPDLILDRRYAGMTACRDGEPTMRFYAGVPLCTGRGHAIGTLAVLDSAPREFDEDARQHLLALGRQAAAQIEQRRLLVALQKEIQARRRAETALHLNEERFNEFMNRGPAAAYIKDEEGRFLYVNEPLARAFNRPVEQWLGHTDAEIIGASAAVAVQENDLTVLNTEQMVVTQEIASTPDNLTHYWMSYKFLLRGESGTKRVAGLSFDITEQKVREVAHERLIGELREALAHVKTLKGFIPICASCKNIRDDAGYWQRIEQYLSKHSEVEFTHGICPDCLDKLYPDFSSRVHSGGT